MSRFVVLETNLFKKMENSRRKRNTHISVNKKIQQQWWTRNLEKV